MPVRFQSPEESPTWTGSSFRSLPATYRKASANKDSENDGGRIARAPSVVSVDEDNVWSRKMVLCLDGGGGSGHSQLLILMSLMNCIKKVESGLGVQLPFELLPCHYFDYICGTSTGGLLAIMLGRLRLSVETCLKWMGDLETACSQESKLDAGSAQRDLFWGKATDKSLTLLQKMVKMKISKHAGRDFVGDESMCRTIAMCLQKENGASTPYMFRSYKPKDRTPGLLDRNLNAVNNLSVAQVIDAISASRYLSISPVPVESFMDGSPEVNNPSYEVFSEVSNTHRRGDDAIDLLVSVGSGDLQRPRKSSLWTSLRSPRKRVFKMMSRQSESVHRMMDKISDKGETFEYDRLNVPSEDWSFGSNLSKMSVKARMQSDGIKFLKRSDSIRVATNQYLENSNTQLILRKCAEFLVRRRLERAKDSCWDAFAGLGYRCKEPDCIFEHLDRGSFMTHLHDVHAVEHPDLNHFKKMEQKVDDATVLLSTLG